MAPLMVPAGKDGEADVVEERCCRQLARVQSAEIPLESAFHALDAKVELDLMIDLFECLAEPDKHAGEDEGDSR